MVRGIDMSILKKLDNLIVEYRLGKLDLYELDSLENEARLELQQGNIRYALIVIDACRALRSGNYPMQSETINFGVWSGRLSN